MTFAVERRGDPQVSREASKTAGRAQRRTAVAVSARLHQASNDERGTPSSRHIQMIW
jgi:hypothetical protein